MLSPTSPSSPVTAAFLPIGEMTSPTRGHMSGSSSPLFVSPVRVTHPTSVADAATPPAVELQFAQRKGIFATPLHASSASDHHVAAASSFVSPVAALAAPSSPSSPAGNSGSHVPPPVGSPQTTWTLGQWHAWACSDEPVAATSALRRLDAKSITAPGAAPAVSSKPPSEQLLYPASILLTPPRLRDQQRMHSPQHPPVHVAASASSADDADAAPSLTLTAPDPASIHTAAVPAISAIPSPLPSPTSAVPLAAVMLHPARSPLPVGAPQSTLHIIAAQALSNLHGRLLMQQSWNEWKDQLRVKRMVR